eukprot:gnl/TRDRNA2_/TRDRNA2_88190_c0_seq1.p1 gnl/TRDRNA2_/TRDRNA2_88190_c0~~gnl/TRDRNA2_/TRDRNA2_88190_c0_seq1.p1  ORF type:complete len:349 (+),score=79.34 gnl/TRDRNA2_/TRDRNA2_88190_c0_seq1:51-1097(+)
MEVNITVSAFTGTVCTLCASLDWTVRRVHDEIEKSSGIPRSDQRLFFKTGPLVASDVQCLRDVLPLQEYFVPGADSAFKCGPRGGLVASLELFLLRREPESLEILEVLESGSKETVNKLLDDGNTEVLQRDPELVKLAYGISKSALRFASKDFVFAEVSKDPTKLKYVSAEHKTDEQLILAAVQKLPESLREAGRDMQNNKAVVLAALESGAQAWHYVSAILKNDKDVVLKLVGRDGMRMCDLPTQWKADRDVVLAAVRSAGCALQFAPEELLNDRVIALTAVRRTASAAKYVSKELLADRDFWMVALSENGEALKYSNDDIRNDEELVSLAVQQNGCFERKRRGIEV